MWGKPKTKREKKKEVIYIFKFFDVVVGEDVGFLEINVGIQGLSHQGLPEGRQEVERQRNICSNGDAQELPEEMEQLLLRVGDGAGRQDVLALQKHTNEKKRAQAKPYLITGAQPGGPQVNRIVKILI